LKDELLTLIKIQECDSQLVKLSGKKKLLPESIEKLDREFSMFEDNIKKNKVSHDEIKARRTENENKIKKINENIVKTKERMLEVKNNKEYQAMLKEIETAESSRNQVESEIITLLEELDKLAVLVKKDEEILQQGRQKYDRIRKRWKMI